MVISKGTEWGWAASLPVGLLVCETDAEAAAEAAAAMRRGQTAAVTLRGGDLWRTVGGSDGVGLRPDCRCLPVDLGVVSLDGGPDQFFAAHTVGRRRAWSGETLIAMNAAWLGEMYLGPRAHPNDGLLDVTVGALPLRQRFEARRRAVSGTHLPHPLLTMTRTAERTHTFARPTTVTLDGISVGTATRLDLGVIEDAFHLFV